MRVALDGTPLLGRRTGIGRYTEHLLTALAGRDDVTVSATAFTLRGAGSLRDAVPPGVATQVAAGPGPVAPVGVDPPGGPVRFAVHRAYRRLPCDELRAPANGSGRRSCHHPRPRLPDDAGHRRRHQPGAARTGAAQPGAGGCGLHAEPSDRRSGPGRLRARGRRTRCHAAGRRPILAGRLGSRWRSTADAGRAAGLLPLRRYQGTAEGSGHADGRICGCFATTGPGPAPRQQRGRPAGPGPGGTAGLGCGAAADAPGFDCWITPRPRSCAASWPGRAHW